MSWQAFQAVRDHSKVTDNQGRLIMFTIASYCNEYGNMDNVRITPSYATIANGASCHKQTVKNWINKLVDTGELSYKKVQRGARHMVRFTINLPMSTTEIDFDYEMEVQNKSNDYQSKDDILKRIDTLENKIDKVCSMFENSINEQDSGILAVQSPQSDSRVDCTHKDNKDNKGEVASNDAIKSSNGHDEITQTNETKESEKEQELSPIENAKQYTIEQLRNMEYNQKHPVSSVWIHANHRKIPNNQIKKLIGDILSVNRFDGEVLANVCILWDSKGYKKVNYHGKIDWYKQAMKSQSPLDWQPNQQQNQAKLWTAKSVSDWHN